MKDKLINYSWGIIHNCFVHPLIGIFGWRKWTEWLHEKTGERWQDEGTNEM